MARLRYRTAEADRRAGEVGAGSDRAAARRIGSGERLRYVRQNALRPRQVSEVRDLQSMRVIRACPIERVAQSCSRMEISGVPF
jgi:hypothetical protein